QVSISRRNNLILTTIEGYLGEFLLKQPLESWTKLIIYRVLITFNGAKNLQLLYIEILTYNKN
ncbi:hypothetical protein COCHEDRAFT_1122374, partial [Bipolaris maydis C5]